MVRIKELDDEGGNHGSGGSIKLNWNPGTNGKSKALAMLSTLLLPVLLLGVQFASAVSPSNTKTSLTLLYQNNLNASDDVNHISFILLDSFSQKDASAACLAIGETLLSKSVIQAHKTDFLQSLSYEAYSGRASPLQFYLIKEGVTAIAESLGTLSFPLLSFSNPQLPVLCTQSSNESQPGTAIVTSKNSILVASGGNTYLGYRNLKSFRFLGIPYAETPVRFEYSRPFQGTGKTIDATKYGPQCAQKGSGDEDCLFVNIQTPYIPKAGSTKKNLRPVMFWSE